VHLPELALAGRGSRPRRELRVEGAVGERRCRQTERGRVAGQHSRTAGSARAAVGELEVAVLHERERARSGTAYVIALGSAGTARSMMVERLPVAARGPPAG